MIDRQNQSGKVTLEDLLRLKRAERPPEAFWAEFDRTLHAKQLAAIVEKRPWWRQYAWLRTARWSLPLSAAAALAVTVATVSHPTVAKLKSRPNPAREDVKTAAPPPLSSASTVALSSPTTEKSTANAAGSTATATQQAAPAISLASLERKSVAPVFTAAVASVAAPVASVVAARHASSAQSLSMTEQIAGLAVSSDTETPNARFAVVSAKDSLSSSQVGSFFDKTVARLDTNIRPARVVEPLSQVPTPREARRARLVALLSLPGYDDAVDSSSTVSRSRERSLSHFNDQALYDAISRLEMKSSRREAAIQF